MTEMNVAEAVPRRLAAGGNATRFSPLFIFISDVAVLSVALPMVQRLETLPDGLDGVRPLFAVVLLLWGLTMGHYSRRTSAPAEAFQFSQCLGLICLADAIAVHHTVGQWMTGLVAIHGLVLLAALLTARHLTRRVMDAAGLWHIPILVLGGVNGPRIAAALDSAASRGYRTVGVIDPAAADAETQINAACDRANVQMAVVEAEAAQGDRARRLIQSLRARGLGVAVAPSLTEMPVAGLQAQKFFSHDVVLLTPSLELGRDLTHGAKRMLDVMVSATLLLLASPLMAAVALAVKSDGGPLLFGHQRVGHSGRMFRCWKFRTMVPNAEAVLKEVLANDPVRADEWRQTLKLKNDPRVTRFGDFLRRSSLDELPQLFNVLRGDMSLIGPRPVTTGELDRYGDAQAYYLAVRPGITGLWQVSGRNDTSYGQRVQLDSWYVRNWSLWNDLVILIKTVPAVLRRSGAY